MENEHKGIKQNIVTFLKNLWLFLLLLPFGLLLFTGTVAAQIAVNEFTIQIQMDGASELEVEYGSDFTDPGAVAYVSGNSLLQKPEIVGVTASGYVNTNTIGTYSLVYTAKFGDVEKSATRTVYVVDTTPPVITLVSNSEAYTLPGQPYQEEGFTAYDACDGDITDRVQSVEEDGFVYYSVKDSSGNIDTVTRKIVYDDKTPPQLTLLGDKVVTIYKGTPYQEAGCTGTDDSCKDVANRIAVSGSVDEYTVGSYVITYQATDDYGNSAQIQRVVHVVQHPNEEKVIYLTFDDGPSIYTKKLLDVLKKYDVKATFFLVNTGSISTAKRIVDEGHAVGIHSISHTYKEIYASEEAFMNDLYGMQKIIRDHTGVTTYLMRFPGGSSNKVSSFNPGIMSKLVKRVEAEGFQYFDWNVGSNDTSNLTPEQICQNVINGIRRTSKAVVLQHDIYDRSVSAVEGIIQWGLENGYTFAALEYNSPTAHHGVNN